MKTNLIAFSLTLLAGCAVPGVDPSHQHPIYVPPPPVPAAPAPTKSALAPKPLVSQNSYTPSNAPASVSLAWDLSPDPRVIGYNVYEGALSRNYTNLVNVGNTNFAAFGNLVRGSTYYFAATCYTTNGAESDFSLEAAYTVPAPILPPTGLHLLVLTVQASTNLLNWDTVLGPVPVLADQEHSFYRSVLSLP